MKTKSGRRLTIYLPQALYRRYAAEAKARKVTIGKVVRERLEAERPSVVDTLGDLVGSLVGAPPDLSSDPKWMKNFGEDIG
jgi:hypothetical protein